VALIVAERFEDAREAAYKLRVSYDAEEPASGLDSKLAEVVEAKKVNPEHEDPSVGDAEGAFSAAPV